MQTISLFALFWVMVWHFSADFIAQTDWQARNKDTTIPRFDLEAQVRTLGADSLLPPEKTRKPSRKKK